MLDLKELNKVSNEDGSEKENVKSASNLYTSILVALKKMPRKLLGLALRPYFLLWFLPLFFFQVKPLFNAKIDSIFKSLFKEMSNAFNWEQVFNSYASSQEYQLIKVGGAEIAGGFNLDSLYLIRFRDDSENVVFKYEVEDFLPPELKRSEDESEAEKKSFALKNKWIQYYKLSGLVNDLFVKNKNTRFFIRGYADGENHKINAEFPRDSNREIYYFKRSELDKKKHNNFLSLKYEKEEIRDSISDTILMNKHLPLLRANQFKKDFFEVVCADSLLNKVHIMEGVEYLEFKDSPGLRMVELFVCFNYLDINKTRS